MDDVFRALDGPSRRLLLDRLFERDGQTLGELCEHLPQMTRFGVMNHLRILEEARLVTTRRVGRSKHHYLNRVPIRLVHDRWISKYTEPIAGAMAGLKRHLEQGAGSVTKPVHIYQVLIDCTREAAWNAIVDGDLTVDYYYGTRVESDWQPGSPIRYTADDGTVVADGEVLAIDEGKRVEMTFHAHWDPELEAEGPVRMAWSVDDAEGLTRVVVECYDYTPASKTYREFSGGLVHIVSGMKTLLETGRPMASR